MKRALALGAIFVVGLLSALTLAGGGLSWYTTSTQTTTETTTTTTDTMTATVLCPNGNPNTGGKDGHPGNDSCALDETTQTTTTTPPPAETTVPPTTETVTTTETSPPEVTTETTETTATVTETPPPESKPNPPRQPHSKPPCKNGTPRVNGRCHPIVRGSG